jgi:SAM-dependent methyltransferase
MAAKVNIGFFNGSFVDLPFSVAGFDFVWDMGCFHHVKPPERHKFIEGIHCVLKPRGAYMLTCFSYRNGPGWNHFTKRQLINHFGAYFIFG